MKDNKNNNNKKEEYNSNNSEVDVSNVSVLNNSMITPTGNKKQ